MHFSCARIPGSLFVFKIDRTYLLACLLASIQPRTSFVKFARSPRTDPPGVCTAGCANNIMLIYAAVLLMWKGACNATHFVSYKQRLVLHVVESTFSYVF